MRLHAPTDQNQQSLSHAVLRKRVALSSGLNLESHALLRLPGPGPWVDIKVFRYADPPEDPVIAVAHLLAHPEYRDDYCSPENTSAGGPRHGPYWADRMTAGDFTLMALADCEETLHAWVQGLYSGDLPATERQQVDSVLRRCIALMAQADHRLYLRQMRDEAEHDWGWVLGDFHEFVLLCSDGSLQVLVASAD